MVVDIDAYVYLKQMWKMLIKTKFVTKNNLRTRTAVDLYISK